MTTTKQRAFYKWLEECPVEFQYQMEFNSKQENCTDEMYIFRNIPNIELTQPQSKEDPNA
tara:strand:+ start:476 stop:655 length:180 start_codon:yes stop_codon:yes gene_type:complete